jgi:hypothetical protein
MNALHAAARLRSLLVLLLVQHAVSAPLARQGSDCSTLAVTDDEVACADRGPYQDSAEVRPDSIMADTAPRLH